MLNPYLFCIMGVSQKRVIAGSIIGVSFKVSTGLFKETPIHTCIQTNRHSILSCIHELCHSFIGSFLYSFVRPSVRPSVRPCVCLFVCLFVCSFLPSFIRSILHSIIDSLVHSVVHSSTYSFIHSILHTYLHIQCAPPRLAPATVSSTGYGRHIVVAVITT